MVKNIKNLAARSTAASLFLSLIACGQAQDMQNQSETKVTNGLSAKSEFPSVIMLQFNTGDGNAICTGTFVNDSQVLTAAHCVYDLVQANRSPSFMTFNKVQADGTSKRIAAVRLEYHPGYTVETGKLSNHDLAIVTFPRGSAPGTTGLYPKEASVGQKFTIVGFGLNDYRYDSSGKQTGAAGSGIKRKGENQIAELDQGMIRFYGVPTAQDPNVAQGQDVASGSGDSGGPLFIAGALAAVTSGGGLATGQDENGQKFTVKVSNYVELNEPSNREFLSQHLLTSPGW